MIVFPTHTVLFSLAILFFLQSAWFIIFLFIKRTDIVDIAWGANAVFLIAVHTHRQNVFSDAGYLVLTMIFLWGLRLGLYIFFRNLDRPDDKKYKLMKISWKDNVPMKTYFGVFLFQGILLFAVVFGAVSTIVTDARLGLEMLDFFGIAIWIGGFLLETAADFQLLAWKRTHKTGIFAHGLWKYSRHPNYFGDGLMWWGIFFISLSSPVGLLTIISPIFYTILMFVSGIPTLEKRYRGNKVYAAYKKKTSSFFPLPPREG